MTKQDVYHVYHVYHDYHVYQCHEMVFATTKIKVCHVYHVYHVKHTYLLFLKLSKFTVYLDYHVYQSEKVPIPAPVQASYVLRLSTNTNLCYLKFVLTNCSWEKNCQSSATRSVEVTKLPQRKPLRYLFQWKGQKSTLSLSFIMFSEREPFLGGSCVVFFLAFLVPKVHWGVKKMRKKKFLKGKPIWYRGLIGTILFVLHFCNQLVSKMDDKSCTGKRNFALPL